jgi:DNA repair photolyase
LREHLRFFHTVDPAIARKRDIEGAAIKNNARLRVLAIERLGIDLSMYDITTGTGDFIADGVVSHNCYARPSHQYWGFGAGTDFETKLIAKVNAPEKLRETFGKKSWRGESITFSGNTDCYQPLEASYRLTRRCLEVCLEFQNPVHVITKSALVRRDVEVIAALARRARAGVTLSIPFCDEEMARHVEPFAAKPALRFEALRVLGQAGVETSVNIAPVIPGLSDSQIPEILERARDAGATHAGLLPVRLPAEVKPVFFERLERAYPHRVAKVESALLQIRGGKLNESRFVERMTGLGPRWEAIRALFEAHCRRLGLNVSMEGDDEDEPDPDPPTTFRRPSRQGELF